jgi:hypothetical protein
MKKTVIMTNALSAIGTTTALLDHTQLPESNMTWVKNDQEHPQVILLKDPILRNTRSDRRKSQNISPQNSNRD